MTNTTSPKVGDKVSQPAIWRPVCEPFSNQPRTGIVTKIDAGSGASTCVKWNDGKKTWVNTFTLDIVNS